MLLEEFDSCKTAIINPEHFHQKSNEMPATCVSFFSKEIINYIVDHFNVKKIECISNATSHFPIYKLDINGTEIAIYQSPVGAPACVGCYEELIALGAKNLLLVGCCGCLDDKIEEYSIIIPTAAIRDEGTSYHYEKANDETVINPKVVSIIENVIKKLKLNYIKGKTWTTDAIFRETKAKTNKRRNQGAITVDMECSAMNVVSNFRNVNFGQIFYAADNLGGEEYDPRKIMTSAEDEIDKINIIPIAFEWAIEMNNLLK